MPDRQVPVLEKILFILVITFIGLVVLFGLSAIFVEGFRQEGSTLVGVILAALTTMAGTLLAAYLGRDVRTKKEDKE